MPDLDLTEFLEGPVAIVVGSCSAEGMPDCVRGYAARAFDGGRRVRLVFPARPAATLVKNVAEHPKIAAVFSQVTDYQTYQLKGRVTWVGPGDDDDRRRVERYRPAFVQTAMSLGFPKTVANLEMTPEVAVLVDVEEIYRQTPGPGAGARVGGPR